MAKSFSTEYFRKHCRAGVCERCQDPGVVLFIRVESTQPLWQCLTAEEIFQKVPSMRIELCDWCQLAWSWGLRDVKKLPYY
jgi:hypothetical protein